MRLLHNIKMVLKLSCRQASTLLSRSQDAPLTFSERLALRLHLLICRSCRRFTRQLSLLRKILRAYTERSRAGRPPTAPLTGDERHRILERLARALKKRR